MNKKNDLLSIAIMKTQWEKNKNDFVDILVPFVLYVISTRSQAFLSISETKNDLLDEFGLDIPSNVVEVIFKRITKEKYGYLKLENSIFKYTDKEIDVREFCEMRESTKIEQEKVIDSLFEFLNNEQGKNYSRLEVEEKLITYLSKYGTSIVMNHELQVNNLDLNASKYEVGKFLELVYEQDKEVFRGVENIVKGFMVANSMYFHDISKDSTNMKFKDTSIYLDTTFLFYSLGYSGERLEETCLELLKILKDLGANLKSFSHIISEIKDILDAFCSMYESGNLDSSFGYDYFIELGYNSSDIIYLISKLETNIRNLGIEIVDTPSYKNVQDNIGWQNFNKYLSEKISYKRDDRRLNDIESIASIYRLRKGCRPQRIEDCKAIFVTTNSSLVNYTKRYFDEIETRNEYSAIIDDVSLTSISWLKVPNSFPDIPRLYIIADALAAQKPNREFWDIFSKEVIKLESEGDISKEESLELRYQIFSKNNLMDITHGDSDKISHKTIKEILARNDRIKHEEISKEKNKIKEEYEHKRKQLEDVQDSIEKKVVLEAKRKSKMIKKFYTKLGMVITSILVLFTIYSCFLEVRQIFVNGASGAREYFIIIGLLLSSLTSIVQNIKDDSLYKDFINNREQHAYQKVYEKAMKNNGEILEIINNK